MIKHWSLILFFIAYFFFVVFQFGTYAQTPEPQKLTPTVSPFTITPTQSINQSELIQKRLDILENRVDQVSNQNDLYSRIDTLISSLSLFSTVILGVLGLIGLFFGFSLNQLRKEAKDDLHEIEKIKSLSLEMYANNKKVFEKYQEAMDKTIENADRTIRVLSGLLNQAGQQTQAIESLKSQAETAMSAWRDVKAFYSNASQGTAAYFETPSPPLAQAAARAIKKEESLAELLRPTERRDTTSDTKEDKK